MKTRLLLVGNSHSACRYEAADILHARIPREAVSWICQGANVAPFAVDAQASAIRPRFGRQRSAVIEVYIRNGVRVEAEAIAGDPGLPLDAVTDVVLSSIGVAPPGVLLEEHICWHMSRVPTSDALIAAWVRGQSIARALPRLAALRKAGFAGRIFVTPWVRPFDLPSFCSPESWKRYCRIEYEALGRALTEVRAVLLPYPAGSEVFTQASLTTGKAAVHGNRRYGELVNQLLLDVASPEASS